MTVHMKVGSIFQQVSDRPTAIFAGNDDLAVGVQMVLKTTVFVPDDLTYRSNAHTILTRIVRPQLTSGVVPLYNLGAVVCVY